MFSTITTTSYSELTDVTLSHGYKWGQLGRGVLPNTNVFANCFLGVSCEVKVCMKAEYVTERISLLVVPLHNYTCYVDWYQQNSSNLCCIFFYLKGEYGNNTPIPLKELILMNDVYQILI